MSGRADMTRTGPYELLEEIGSGGFGRVCRARHVQLDEIRAIKLATDAEFVRQLRKEGRVLSRLRHPRIVLIYDMDVEHEPPYIVMEYVEGGDLRQRLDQGPLPVEDSLRIVLDVLEALEHAHSEGVIHRDIKPSNILLDRDGRAKVSDFGLGRIVEEASMSLGRVQSMRSGSGDVSGTLQYMSPEQLNPSLLKGEELDGRSDLYSLGLVLYEMLTGEFAAGISLPTPSEQREGIPGALDEVFRRCVAGRRDQRYRTAGEVAHTVRAISEGQAAQSPSNGSDLSVGTTREQPDASSSAGAPSIWVVSEPGGEPEEWPLGSAPETFAYEEEGVTLDIPLSDVLVVNYSAGQTLLRNGHRIAAVPLDGHQLVRFDEVERKVAGYVTRQKVQAKLTLGRDVRGAALSAEGLEHLAQELLPRDGEVWVCPTDGREMVYVPAGIFLMGSREGEGDRDEYPQREVYLDAFWIDKTEVTVGEYRRFCEATGRRMPEAPTWEWRNDHPIVKVSWHDAAAYAEWAGKRLPTEAEWEKTARGTDGRTYPWGNEGPGSRHCNARGTVDGHEYTAPVGSYANGASPYGCLDMAGNVWEWCADWYGGDYYEQAPSRNPAGPSSGQYRVVRGGSWDIDARIARCAARFGGYPTPTYFSHGFRCARDSS